MVDLSQAKVYATYRGAGSSDETAEMMQCLQDLLAQKEMEMENLTSRPSIIEKLANEGGGM